MTPLISVIIPILNQEAYLADAIESILTQTYKNIEIIAIDDGSTDSTPSLLKKYPIRIITHTQKQGIVSSLNEGIEAAKGTFIARMDGDDICHPTRFEKQLAFLEKNLQVGILGTGYTPFQEKNNLLKSQINPFCSDEIKCKLLFTNPIAHPTVLMRKNIFSTLSYKETTPHAEDYALWVQASHITSLCNLQESLLHYRIHPQSVTQKNNTIQQTSANAIRKIALQKLGLSATEEELTRHNLYCNNQLYQTAETQNQLKHWFRAILKANLKKNYIPNKILTKFLTKKWVSHHSTSPIKHLHAQWKSIINKDVLLYD